VRVLRTTLLALGVTACATAPTPVTPPRRVVAIERVEVVPFSNTVDIVTRTTWDDTPPGSLGGVTRYATPLAGQLEWIVIHHSAFTQPEGPVGIERYHLEVSGFADIGYHFIVATDGTVYEGRDIHKMGAHAGIAVEANDRVRDIRSGKVKDSIESARRLDPDFGAIGVVVDGFFFNGHRPTVAQHRSLVALVRQLQTQYGIDADHVIAHNEVRARITEARGLTHSGKETQCPGPGLVPLVAHVRKLELTETASPPELDRDAALLEYCYKDWRHRGGRHLLETITMRFVTNGAGEVLTAELDATAPVDGRFLECTQEALYELRVAAQGTVELRLRYRDQLEGAGGIEPPRHSARRLQRHRSP